VTAKPPFRHARITRAGIAVQLGTIYQGARELTKPLISSFTPEMLRNS